MKKLTAILPIFFLLFFTVAGFAQQEQKIDDRNPQAMMKATFLFQFGKQSNWPMNQSAVPFIIAVYGNDDIYDYLSTKYETQPIGNQTLKVIKITSLAELDNASIVFIDSSKMEDFDSVKFHFKNEFTMLVTDSPGALKKGSVINFIIVDGGLRIEINNKEADRKKIGIGVALVKWAVNEN